MDALSGQEKHITLKIIKYEENKISFEIKINFRIQNKKTKIRKIIADKAIKFVIVILVILLNREQRK